MNPDKYADFEGPSDEELTEAYRRHDRKRAATQGREPSQGSRSQIHDTPRRAKHRGASVNGVRIT